MLPRSLRPAGFLPKKLHQHQGAGGYGRELLTGMLCACASCSSVFMLAISFGPAIVSCDCRQLFGTACLKVTVPLRRGSLSPIEIRLCLRASLESGFPRQVRSRPLKWRVPPRHRPSNTRRGCCPKHPRASNAQKPWPTPSFPATLAFRKHLAGANCHCPTLPACKCRRPCTATALLPTTKHG